MDLWQLSAVEQLRLLRSRRLSARELLDAHLDRIAAVNSEINAVVALDAEVAVARATEVDETVAQGGDPGPLGGLVTAHKDLSETADFPTTYGSPLFAGHRPEVDATFVARMKAAGVVAVGKTNTPEWGAGSHTFNPVYGLTRNPYDLSRSAGGSSGGAAAALSTGMVSVADGSDVGGSLRNPAAWCNVVGLRPSPRIVPRLTAPSPWSILPTEGPMARSVEDLVLLLRVLAVPDDRDPLSRPVSLERSSEPEQRRLRVAWSTDLGGLPIEPEITEVLAGFRRQLDDLGWDVVDDEPDVSGADACFEVLRAWSFANGPVGKLGDRQLGEVKAVVRDEVMRGRNLSGADVAEAEERLGELWRRAGRFFEDVDLLVAPVTQAMPFPVELEYPAEVAGQAMTSYVEWMRVVSRVTVLGLPALSLPAGFGPSGLPVGAQLIGPRWGDAGLLRAAAAIEAATGHGARRPSL